VIALNKDDAQIVVARPEKEKIELVLEKTGMNKHDIHCSICNKQIVDVSQIRAIFPYHSALICCDNILCLIECRNKLLAESNILTPKGT
jgi:hypothetical protein